MDTTKQCKRPGSLVDHADCYQEVCRLERKIVELRAELAELKATKVRETTKPDWSLNASDW